MHVVCTRCCFRNPLLKIQRWTNLNGNGKTPLTRHNNCKFSSFPTHTKAEVIKTKPMLMVLDSSIVIFNLETWITWSRSSTYWFVNVDPCFAFEVMVFGMQNIELQICVGTPSTQIFSFNFKPPQDNKGNKSL